MKKIYLLLILSCLGFSSFGQTAASYGFTAFSSTYTSISSTGTAITTGFINCDDCNYASISIGFSFTFCGTTYTTLSACTNGWLSLANSASNVWTNANTGIASAGWLMPLWEDLQSYSSIPSSAYYQTTGTAPNRVFTFEWKDWGAYTGCGSSCTGNFQVKLYETSNVIDFIYGSCSYTSRSETIGIANSTSDWQTLPDLSTSPIPSSSTFTTSLSGEPASGQVYRWQYQCSGTPTAGTVCPSVDSACTSSYTSVLSLCGASGASGLTYQWQISSDNITYTNITGATNATYTVTVTANVWYKCTLTCTYSGLSATTPGMELFVFTNPAAVTGPTVECVGQTLTLSDATTGGTWISGSTGVASVGSLTGVVTGVAAGTAVITYRLRAGGCISTTTISVYTAPGPILGATNVCTGFTTNLFNAATGGVWASSNTGVATIGSSTGFVTGVTAGTTIITYTLSAGCFVTATMTVFQTPPPITGPTVVCVGSTITESDATSGGNWSSSNITIANVTSTTGVVTGNAAGTAVISYIMGTGCFVTTTVLVNPIPASISGPTNVCEFASMALSSATGLGTWVSSNTGVATVGSTTAIVTGVSAGTTIITYILPTGCKVTYIVTVNPVPAAITGTVQACVGFDALLADATAGGFWSSSDPAIGSIASTGMVTGEIAGTVTISYTLATGCYATTSFTVNPTPNPITGLTAICLGYTTTLSDTGSGVWTSSNTTVAPIGSSTGIVTGATLGGATITYTLPTGCYTTLGVTVYPNPSPITGSTLICVGGSTTLLDATSGGTWSSSNTTVAPIIATLGLATGLSAGTTIITYTLSTGCYITTTLTVSPAPTAITGVASLCVGATTTLGDAVAGGTWTSSNATTASVGSTTGVVTGNVVGTAIITYSLGGTCRATRVVTVTAGAGPITGTLGICVGGSTILADVTTGGTWSSSITTVATVVSTSGVVTGLSAGTTTISYTLGTGCSVTRVVTVYPTPGAITGTTTVCVGLTTALGNSAAGGTWVSSASGIASVGGTTGIVLGVASGSAIITYSLGGICSTTTTVSVRPNPVAITGPTSVCEGATITLADATAGGSWSSSTTGVSVNSSTGAVTGITAGTTTITYRLPTGCLVTTNIIINPSPTPITGLTNICAGTYDTLSNGIAGGTWTSSNISVATVGTGTGSVLGVAAGSATITYSLAFGCNATRAIAVYPSPGPITGPTALCAGSTATLSDAVAGGTWISSNTSVATIASGSGVVTGVALGTTIITYSIAGFCNVTSTVTISPSPTAIVGPSTICQGQTITYTDGVPGGLWYSSNVAVATANSTSGNVTGISSGSAIISYSLGTGCLTTKTINVSPIPGIISGVATLCQGSTATFTDATAGGTWTSSASGTASAGSTTGVITGVAPGTAVISYSLGTGCAVTTTVTVLLAPGPIAGTLSVCQGLTTALADGIPGGTWTSSNTAIGTIDASTGIATGISAGTTIITYAISTGCNVRATLLVNPISPITGSTSICIGNTTTLADATTGGTWSSSSTAVATVIAGTGVVTGVATGSTIITYILSTGCSATTTVNVSATPTAITGTTSMCAGSTSLLSDGVPGGIWTSSATGVATVGSTTGLVSGVAAGTSIITYSLGSGCIASKTVSVITTPTAIGGPSALCLGTNITLTNGVAGGTWVSSLPGVATIGATSGLVTAISLGTTVITYTLSSGCSTTTTVNVSLAPTAILGSPTVCTNSSTTLTDAVTGGGWISSSTAVATVGSLSGVLTGVTSGPVTITYSLGSGCSVTRVFTVIPSPNNITGPAQVCVGNTITLSDVTTGGTWTSSSTTNATITAGSGIVSGIAAGTTTITYMTSNGCFALAPITVNPLPAPITGPSSVCTGSTITLADASIGTWSSSSIAMATVGGTTGVVSGISSGIVNIIFTTASGCIATASITVNPSPSAIVGPSQVCEGSLITLNDGVAGGTWSSSDATVSVGSTTGFVTGVAAGTALVTYKLPAGCFTTKVITVNPSPGPIGGTPSACTGGTTVVTDVTPGGVWSISSAIASIGASSGTITAILAGTATISYTLGGVCSATITLTVYPTPVAIGGPGIVCEGSNITLTDGTPGGLWTSGSLVNAIVGSTTGIVTGVSAGTASISYSLSAGCSVNKIVTINQSPAPISGTSNMCVLTTSNFTDAVAGGRWVSTNTAVATIGSGTGLVSALIPGSAIISYILPSGCQVSQTLIVNPTATPIVGNTNLCTGVNSLLTNSISGGVWTSSNTAVATIGTSGLAFGVAVGTSMITYTIGAGCITSTMVTVFPSPAAITGAANLCMGTTITVADGTPGGRWASSSASASVNSTSGLVNGVSAGTAIISYIMPSGCNATTSVTVYPVANITGSTNLCQGSTITLANTVAGGTWSSLLGTASIDLVTGVVTGLSAGTTMITYTTPRGCISTFVINVNALPGSISGPANLCVADVTTLTSATSGGTWASSFPGIASIGASSGLTTGIALGTTIITYTLATGCNISQTMLVNPLPAPISGSTNSCAGTTITLSDITPGGTWSGGAGVLTIGATTGIITGSVSGVAVISYTLPTGCAVTTTLNVNPLPSPIAGASQVCEGQFTTLSDPSTGGLWSSPDITVSIGSTSGVVAGLTPGLAHITYTLPTGCITTTTFTVIPVPRPISGSPNVCVGFTTTMFDATPGGTWTSGNPSVGSIDPLTGNLGGLASGTILVSYTLGTGCGTVTSIIVNPVSPIAGPSTVCQGQTVTLSDTTLRGTWSSSNILVATATTTGDSTASIRGVTVGSVVISYNLPTGCIATHPMTVIAIPPPITGPSQVCQLSTITLRDIVPFGTWASGSTAIATIIPTTGVLTGVTPGTAIISYTASGCPVTTVITVNPLPAPITGSTNVCVGSTTLLSDATPLGAWSSSRPATATVGPFTGLVTGVTTGSATIIYSILATGCSINVPVIVNPLPDPIVGSPNLCVGSTNSLTDPTPGGLWTSSSPLIASIDLFSGNITGVAAGTTTVTYQLSTGCIATKIITVNNLPPAITGPSQVCVGANITLSNASVGGTWLSGGTLYATVGATTGVVRGVSAGVVPIIYTSGVGCTTVALITVNPVPLPITGFNQVCVDNTTSLSDATPGGVWTPTTGSIATVDTASGVVTGVSGGMALISYKLTSTGCFTTMSVYVYPNPTPITGNPIVCLGSTSTLRNTVPGGSWYSSNTTLAPIDVRTGVVTGVGLCTATIIYVIGPGCTQAIDIMVVPLPNVYSITGGGNYCAGGTGVAISLTNSSTGVNYMLYRGSTAVGAFAGTGSALPLGMSTVAGVYHVTATSTITGCSVGMTGTVNVIIDTNIVPSVGITTGVGDTVCAGTSTTFTALPTGGGTTPLYQWKVNGTPVGTGTSYTFVPADRDVISVVMTSNAHCVLPATATGTKTMTVPIAQTPTVYVHGNPSDTVCKGMSVAIYPSPNYGGYAPSYYWMVNSRYRGAGSPFVYIPNNHDTVTCVMTSNYPCLVVDTALSPKLLLEVDTPLIPHVTISANPGFTVGYHTLLTLTANVIDGGLNPTYQWIINSVPVIGATNATFTHSGYDSTFEDSVSVVVTSSGICPISAHNWSYVQVSSLGVNNSALAGSSIHISPNPNRGEFTITGNTGVMMNDEVALEITNVLGQVIYKSKIRVNAGKIDERIILGNNPANGMYILNLRSETDNLVFHMVVEQ